MSGHVKSPQVRLMSSQVMSYQVSHDWLGEFITIRTSHDEVGAYLVTSGQDRSSERLVTPGLIRSRQVMIRSDQVRSGQGQLRL